MAVISSKELIKLWNTEFATVKCFKTGDTFIYESLYKDREIETNSIVTGDLSIEIAQQAIEQQATPLFQHGRFVSFIFHTVVLEWRHGEHQTLRLRSLDNREITWEVFNKNSKQACTLNINQCFVLKPNSFNIPFWSQRHREEPMDEAIQCLSSIDNISKQIRNYRISSLASNPITGHIHNIVLDNYKSYFDDQIVISENMWAITMVCAAPGSLEQPTAHTLGHTQLIIEKLIEGRYSLDITDIAKHKDKKKFAFPVAVVQYITNFAPHRVKFETKTETWSIPREKIECMVQWINYEINTNGDPDNSVVFYTLRGTTSTAVPLSQLSEYRLGAALCEKLRANSDYCKDESKAELIKKLSIVR